MNMKAFRSKFKDSIVGMRSSCGWIVDDCHASLILLFLYWSRMEGIANASGGSECFKLSEFPRLIHDTYSIICSDYPNVSTSEAWFQYAIAISGFFDRDTSADACDNVMMILRKLIIGLGYHMPY